jgi:hypothetical protein
MRRTLQVLSCLAALAAPMALSTPSFADIPSGGAPPGAQPPHNGEMGQERAERREMREEREKIRAEHESLEAERDRIKVQCMDAKGQDRAACDEKRHAMHEKMEALHKRMKEFHEKTEAQRRESHEGHGDHEGMWRPEGKQDDKHVQQPENQMEHSQN